MNMCGSRVAGKDSNHKLKMWVERHLGGHDIVRRVDRNGEALDLVWKVLGFCARCRLGPKLMHRCKPEKLDTQEHWKMMKKSSNSKEEGCQTGRTKSGELKDGKEGSRMTARGSQRVLWIIAEKRMLEDRGAVPKEDVDLLREYQAMQEEHFLSSWLREDVEGEEAEEVVKMNKDSKEEESKVGKWR